MNIRRFRQGDVLLEEVFELPKDLKKAKNNVLAYGEITGHSHRLDTKEQLVHTNSAGELYALISAPTLLVHEEHINWQQFKPEIGQWIPTDGIIPEGNYKIRNEQEYSYEEESLKTVVD